MQNSNIEECVLACFLLEPKWLSTTKLEEKHFKKNKYIFRFFKEVYSMYGNLDINILYECVKGSSEELLTKAIENLLDVFVISSHFETYEKYLIKLSEINTRDEWLKKKFNEEIMMLNVGKINIDQFIQKINDLHTQSNQINWR